MDFFADFVTFVSSQFGSLDYWVALAFTDEALYFGGTLSVFGVLLLLRSKGGFDPNKTNKNSACDRSSRSVDEGSLSHSTEDSRILGGLSKTRLFFSQTFAKVWLKDGEISKEVFWSELEEGLIASDLGVATSGRLVFDIRESCKGLLPSKQEALGRLELGIRSMLGEDVQGIDVLALNRVPYVIVMVGVNGAGKTTTIGKLARQLSDTGFRVMLAACDTFRAAAREQLQEWASRASVILEASDGSEKPSTVVFRAIEKMKSGVADVLIVDTAGRLHTRVNLMNELEGIMRIISREMPGAPHDVLLVLDGTSGQNALLQAKEFKNKVGVTGLVVTKLDGTSKGGVVVAIRDELGIPIRYIGVGEKIEDLRLFKAETFAKSLLAP